MVTSSLGTNPTSGFATYKARYIETWHTVLTTTSHAEALETADGYDKKEIPCHVLKQGGNWVVQEGIELKNKRT